MTSTTGSVQQRLHRHLTGSRGWLVWAVVVATMVLAGVAAASRLPVVRVGDGMEYYALFYAWADTFRPWMTAESFALYQDLHEGGSIQGTLPASYLQNAFPALRVSESADFNHFWFYSFLAAGVSLPFDVLGIHVGPQASFLFLHALLFVGLMWIAKLCFGWSGVITVALLTFGSPIVWYFNKVHTEFFTFCIMLASVVSATSGRYVASSVLMAAAATQNPGLSFVAVVLFAIRGLGEWRRLYSRWEVIGAVGAVLLLALHPVYYFLRYGVPTPQLLAGGASLGDGVSIAYIWLLDPDVGLFPNWLLGATVAMTSIVLVFSKLSPYKRLTINPRMRMLAIFFGSLFAASIFSHASTTNLNSGATPGISRYALWYIPLLFPAFLIAIESFEYLRRSAYIFMMGLISAFAIGTGYWNLSIVYENYTRPSLISNFIQTHAPQLYDPPAEIFAERYSGLGEGPVYSAVVGPDCRKTLLFPPTTAPSKVTVPEHCDFAPIQIKSWVAQAESKLDTPTYMDIEASNVDTLKNIATVPIDFTMHPRDIDDYIVLTGFSGAELSQRWSEGAASTMRFSVPASSNLQYCMFIDGLTFGSQRIVISVNGKTFKEENLNGPASLIIPLPAQSEETFITFNYSNPQMPPDDQREIAFGLRSAKISSCLPQG